MIPVRYTPTGVMDKDTDLVYINSGNYTHAVNIRHLGDGQNRSVSVSNIKGTELKFSVGSSSTSSKKYRLYIDIRNNAASYPSDMYLYDKNKQLVRRNSGAFVPITTSVADYLDALWTHIQTSTTILGTSALARTTTVVVDANIGYMEIEATSLPRLSGANDLTEEWYLVFVNSSYVKSYVVEEAISIDEEFEVIGSAYAGNKIWLVSTTPSGRGQIGVAVQRKSDDIYDYTSLIKCKHFRFDSDHRVDMQVEETNSTTSFYLTDDKNFPVAMYYDGAIQENGFLIANGGRYDLEFLRDQIGLFSFPGAAHLTVDLVSQGAGALPAGNKRYTGRFITSAGSKTNCIPITNPVPVYSADLAFNAFGDAPGTQTDKVVNLTLKEIPVGSFDYFELICIEYSGDAETAYVVKREQLSSNQTEVSLKHDGLGDDNVPVAIEEIQAIDSFYAKAKNIRIVDTRLVISNVETSTDPYDLSDWASNITHSLAEKDLTSCGLIGDFTEPEGDFQFGEYMDPLNVSYFTGYMKNDTYRFGVEVLWKESNLWSRSFWVDDIKFDTQANNVTSPSRRTANSLSNNLTTSDGATVKVPYVNFTFDLNYVLSDGSRLREKVKAIRFVRAERIPEVLMTGVGIVGVENVVDNVHPYASTFYTRAHSSSSVSYAAFPAAFFPDPGSYQWNGVAYTIYAPAAINTAKNDYLFFFSPDNLLRKSTIPTGKNLKLIVYGVPSGDGYAGTTKANDFLSEFAQYSGYFNATPNSYTVSDYKYLPMGGSTTVGGLTVNTTVRAPGASAGKQALYDNCHVFKTSAAIVNPTAYTNTRMYYVQVREDLGDDAKYPENKELTVYQQTGHIFLIDKATSGSQTSAVYGGDVFTQQTYMKLRYGSGENASVNTEEVGYSGGCSIYSQNTANSQMRHVLADDTVYGLQFPIKTVSDVPGTAWDGLIGGELLYWLDQPQRFYHQNQYQFGYDAKYNIQLNVGYDPNDDSSDDRPSLIAWSDAKIYGSNVDGYRVFQPANYIELVLIDGPIEHMEVVNGSLFSWQHRAFNKHYFNPTGMLKSDQGQEILLGDVGVMSRGSEKISSFGTYHKWSVVKGVSKGGNDTLYWFDYENGKVLRFGADGTYPISDLKFMRYFFEHNTNFCKDPNAISGVYYGKFREVLFTFRAISDATNDGLSEYANFVIPPVFSEGDTYYNLSAPITHYSGMPSVFVCKLGHSRSIGVTDPGTGSDWQTYWDEVAPTDPSVAGYFNLFTVGIDETRGGFHSFFTFYPRIYVSHNSELLSVDPLGGMVHKHDKGPIGRFYGVDFDSEFESVVNYDPNTIKWPEAIRIFSDEVPHRVEFGTQNHESYLEDSDFELLEETYSSTIKNDSSISGINSADTSRMFGAWLKTKIIMPSGILQKVRNYVVKFRESQRDYRR